MNSLSLCEIEQEIISNQTRPRKDEAGTLHDEECYCSFQKDWLKYFHGRLIAESQMEHF